MTGSRREATASEKQRKQRKALLVLTPVLLLLLVWQGPKTVSALRGEQAPATTATPPTTQAPAAPQATSTTQGAAGTANPDPTATAPLPDTDPEPTADPGQLVSFTRFVGKDPFRQQVSDTSDVPSSGDVDDGTPPADTAPAPTIGETEPSSTHAGEDEAAVVEVNGRRSQLRVGASFPSGDDVFRLVSIRDGTARVGLVSGKFSTGKKTIALAPGERIALENEADGTRYVVRLVRVARP
ncbi:MAG: hypothetical protein M3304_06400 [Actinomycetota bacterium]|nr:hypothetical protein [Actinomycetota bacterium]